MKLIDKLLLTSLPMLLAISAVRAQDHAEDELKGPDTTTADTSGAEPVVEETSPFTVDLSTALFSSYMNRGLNLYDGASFQPSITPSYDFGDYGSVSAQVWMQIPADGDREDTPKFFELDRSIVYNYTLAPFTISAGHYWYIYPNGSVINQASNEIYSSIVVDALLSPTLSFYYDYRQYDSAYYELWFSHEFKATGEDGYNFTPFVNFGFTYHGEKYFQNDGLVHITYGISTDLAAGPVTIQPQIAFTDAHDPTGDHNIWFGLTGIISF